MCELMWGLKAIRNFKMCVDIQIMIHNNCIRVMGLQQVKPKEYQKLGVRGKPEKGSKNTKFLSLPAPGSASPPSCPVTGEERHNGHCPS